MFRNKRQLKQDKHTSGNVKQFSFVGNVLVIVVAAVIAIVVCGTAVLLGVSNLPANCAARYMVTAERYLGEMKYEQAIIEFKKLLEIDPMNEDAIIGLADAYTGIGDREKAISVLNNGLELTGARRIEKRLNKLQESTTSSDNANSNSSSSQPVKSSTTSSAVSSNPTAGSNPPQGFSLNYIDLSDYFNVSDILSTTAEGQIITAAKNDGSYPYKSVFLFDDTKIIGLDAVFTSGIYCTEKHTLPGWETPDLVHNNGTQHIYKATSNGTELIKTSPYPMYVTQDGYIAYYASRSGSSVTVNIQSPSGKILSSTKIDGYSDPFQWLYGAVADRLALGYGVLDYVDIKGAAFSYHLYTEQIRNTVTGYYDTKYVRYLFYKTGEVVLDEFLEETSLGVPSSEKNIETYPEKITYLGKTYLSTDDGTQYPEQKVSVIEYYDSTYTPEISFDGYYIEPEYAAYILSNNVNGKYSQLYKELSYAENGLFIGTDFGGRKCFLNANGQEVSAKYEDIGVFGGEYSFVLENGTYYLINRNFDKLLRIEGTDVNTVGDNMFSCVRNGKLHLVRVS